MGGAGDRLPGQVREIERLLQFAAMTDNKCHAPLDTHARLDREFGGKTGPVR